MIFTHAEAIETLKAGAVPYVEYRTKDATLSHWLTVRCWLDSDGDLVQSHPTDSQRSTCAAPTSVRYYVPTEAELAEEADFRRSQDAYDRAQRLLDTDDWIAG